MSSAGTRIPWVHAVVEAEHFRGLFVSCYERWEIAGSIRRGKPDVGDVEHVVIPLTRVPTPAEERARGGGLFEEPIDCGVEITAPVHALWARCDALLAMGIIAKAIYADGKHRWTGTMDDKMRGVLYRGVRHEIFTADAESWFPQLVIRTGPAELSQALVTELKGRGLYRQEGGHVVHAGGPSRGQVRAVASEQEYFELCGYSYAEPRAR